MSQQIEVGTAEAVDGDLLAAMAHLIPKLSSSVPDAERLREIVACPCATLLLARNADGRIIGTLTLVIFPIPTGVRAWIEDVVVDSQARGAGAGEALTRRALEIALSRKARTVELTSNPKRVAANRLYQKLGFKLRETNLYRYTP
jgi:ribosomal protein S18 acetylase RimI-like enzyme